MSLRFRKNKEDFRCEHCNNTVKGNGYTNHCPKCLWSKHVDNNPGDRLSDCGQMMKPINIEMENGEFIITHKCINCGHMKKNKAALDDKIKEFLENNSLPRK